MRGSSPRMTPSLGRRRPRRNVRLIILQQPLEIIELDLRTLRIGEAAAQFFQDPAHPLHVDFARNFD